MCICTRGWVCVRVRMYACVHISLFRLDAVRSLNTIQLELHQVGRAVPNKTKPTHTNAIFDSKVLSRSHAEIWADGFKVYIKDTKSSNGTYLNDKRWVTPYLLAHYPLTIHSHSTKRFALFASCALFSCRPHGERRAVSASTIRHECWCLLCRLRDHRE